MQNVEWQNSLGFYSFGMLMPDRSFSTGYRFGFNGKESDNEVSGQGNQYDYGFRIYNPRIAKFLSVDPLTKNFPSWTPYAYAMNRPIDGVDMDGLEYIRYDKVPGNGSFSQRMMDANDVEKVVYKGNTYYNVGAHVYTDGNGKFSTAPFKGASRLTEWVYNTIAPVIPESDFVKWSTKGECFSNCQEQLSKQGNSSGDYWPSAFQMYKQGSSGKSVTEASKLAGLDALHKAVESGKGIMVGVDYGETESQGKNIDKTTDHFITIVGRGNDANGEFFTFYENAVNSPSEGTDISTNKLYIQGNGTLKGNTSWGTNTTFTVTQVRPNTEE